MLRVSDRAAGGLRMGFAITAILWAAAVSASEPVARLTNTGTAKRDLRFFDKDTLVFCEQIGPRQLALMKVSLSSAQIERLHPDAANNEFEPAFSQGGAHVAFVQNMGNLNLRLVIRNRKTGTTAEFREGGFSGMRSPCFSVDGKLLMYAYPEQGRQLIWSCNLKCQDRKKLIDSSGINNWPGVTPDGKKMVFGSTRDGNFEIYTADTTGERVVRLTQHPRQDIRPRVSSDGKQIAFTSNRDGNYEIYVMPLNGQHPRRVTQHPERDDYPAWHPDGRLAFVAERSGRFDIHLVEVFPGPRP